MSERSIVLISGKPGSGKTTLARNLVATYNHSPEVAAISMGEEVRNIYAGNTTSPQREIVRRHLDSHDPYSLLRDDVVFDIAVGALQRNRHASLIFLDGFPRHLGQIDDLTTFSASHNLAVRGLLETVVSDELAVVRQLKRRRPHDPVTLTNEQAISRVEQYHRYMPATIRALEYRGIHYERVSTTGPKEEALTKAVGAISLMLALGDMRPDSLDD